MLGYLISFLQLALWKKFTVTRGVTSDVSGGANQININFKPHYHKTQQSVYKLVYYLNRNITCDINVLFG